MLLPKTNDYDREESITTIYGSRDFKRPIPKNNMPDVGMPASHAYHLVHDMLMLDGNSRLNLATFVSTWMEDEARQLMSETFDKNMIDKDEYPETAEIEMRCVNMLANLWNAENYKDSIGCSTTGSSEAAMLAAIAMKWRWRERMKKNNKPTDKPNMVMGVNVHVCWEKFCRYWDVEMRLAPMEPGSYALTPEKAMKLCDENTIGVIGILGTTFTGEYEPITELNAAVDKLNQENGWEIPIHVDAASGGFVAPFLQPELIWDFRLKWVHSINTSGHKYGLVYPGVGWIVWRNKNKLPEDLIFNVNYLGGKMPTFALNFSRSGNQIIAQYYNLIRLGREGYRKVHQLSQDVAVYLSTKIAKMGPFELLSDGTDIPVFCWKLKKPMNFTVFDLSERLRHHGWLVPAYTLPENLTNVAVIRVVVKEGFTMELANILLAHIKEALEYFKTQPQEIKQNIEQEKAGFHH